MTAIVKDFPKAFAVGFDQLNRWDPTSFHGIEWYWSKDILFSIAKVLKMRKEKVNRNHFPFSTLQPITIHFDGSVDRRSVDEAHEYTMDLFFARPGDIVVAKIDLKNGAVAIVPDNWNNVVVTNHFAVYEPDRTKLLPEYFHRIIQASFFREYLWRNKVGAEGRKEVKLDFFESIEIPLPSPPIQQAIVKKWQNAQDEIKAKKTFIENERKSLELKVLKRIGISLPTPISRKGAFTLEWKEFERWDTFFFRKDFIEIEKHLMSMNHTFLGEILNFTSRSWKSVDFSEGVFKYVEISSVTKDKGITGSRPVEVNNAPSRATTLIKEGDIILSTTRPYLGAFTEVPSEYNNCVCSSGFALVDKIKLSNIEKEFLLFFLKSPAGLRQMERRMTGGLYPAIVQEELEKIIVPIPPLKVQRDIVQNIKKKEIEIAHEREAVERKTREIKDEIETLILGTKRIKE